MTELTKQELKTLEARVGYLDYLRGRLNEWDVYSKQEDKEISGVILALSKYADYLDATIEEATKELKEKK